jgi:hypothetical protein
MATMVILSVLAVLVAPMGAVIFFQDKELMLKENLREVRNSIDRFYDNNVREFVRAPSTSRKQNYYPMSWQDLYEGYLRKNNALNPITHKFEDFDVTLDKKGIWYSEDFNQWFSTNGISYFTIDDMPYPEDTSSAHVFSVGAEKDTVHLSPEQFAMRQPSTAFPQQIEPIADLVWWQEAGMFDVRFPSKNRPKMMSLDEGSYYHEW